MDSTHWFTIPHFLSHFLTTVPSLTRWTTKLIHYVWDSWYTPTGLRHSDGCRCPIGGRHHWATTMLTRLWLYCHMNHNACDDCHVTAIKQTISHSGQAVRNPLVSLLLVGSPSHSDNALCQWARWRMYVSLCHDYLKTRNLCAFETVIVAHILFLNHSVPLEEV